MKFAKLSALGLSSIMALGLSMATMTAHAEPSKITVSGDSITMGFGASCTGNVLPWDLLCLAGGDQPQHSWFDGTSGNVDSVHEKYKRLNNSITGNKSAAKSGAEMRGGNNFAIQAAKIVAQTPVADHVEVELGGNDLCNRDCIDPANCDDPVYTNGEWRSAVQAGLDILMDGLPDGATVYLGGVPKIQSLRAAGLAKSSAWNVNCESMWSSNNICRIATDGGTLNGESYATRLAGLEERQDRYNRILRTEANKYNSNSNGKNPRGIEVVSNFTTDTSVENTGNFVFGKQHIDGGDCFHPSFAGQNKLANLMWDRNPDK